MKSQLFNALSNVKLSLEFMEKECFEFCAYYRKIAKNHKNWIFSQISKILLFHKQNVFHKVIIFNSGDTL